MEKENQGENKMKIRISLKSISYFLLIFMFVCGMYRGTAISGFEIFSGLGILDKALTLFQYLCYVYVVILFLLRGKFAQNLWYLFFAVYAALIIFSTVLSGVDTAEAINKVGTLVISVLWFYNMENAASHRELELFVASLNLLQIINFIFMLFFFGGMQYANSNTIMGSAGNVYILGYDNGLIIYALPTVFLNFYLFSVTCKKIYKIMIMLVCIPVIISGSFTGIIAIVFVLLLYFSKHIYKAFNGIKGLAVALLLFLGLSNFTLQNLFKPILDYFGKGLTISGRTDIWSWALKYITRSPIIGYGYNTDRARNVFFWQIGVSAAHNQILDVFLQSGTVGLILYFLIYYLSIKSSFRKFRINKNKVAKLQFIIEIVFFFIMVVESYSSYGGYPLLFCVLAFGIGRPEYGKSSDSLSI